MYCTQVNVYTVNDGLMFPNYQNEKVVIFKFLFSISIVVVVDTS